MPPALGHDRDAISRDVEYGGNGRGCDVQCGKSAFLRQNEQRQSAKVDIARPQGSVDHGIFFDEEIYNGLSRSDGRPTLCCGVTHVLSHLPHRYQSVVDNPALEV